MIFTRRASGEWLADFSESVPDLGQAFRLIEPQGALIRDYHLTTANIIYHLPDFPALLQGYCWQEYDKPPVFPALMAFLDFWQRELEGQLHAVEVGVTSTDLHGGYRNAVMHQTMQ